MQATVRCIATALDCFLTLGAKVLGIAYSFWKFQGMKVLETFAPEERKFHGNECSIRSREFLERSFPMNESSTAANVPPNESSICGLLAPGNENVQRNEKSVIKFWYIKMSIAESWQQFVLKKKNLLSYAAVEAYCVSLYESFDEGQQINNCPYNDCRPTRCYLIVRWTGLSILGLCLVRVSVIILKTSYYRHL